MTTAAGQRYRGPGRSAGRPTVTSSPSCGFSLIEVLLASSILLLSMTGLLTIQMVGIKLSTNAYHRTQATNLAYQMTDYLRANCDALDDYLGETLCRDGSRNSNDQRACDIGALGEIVDDPASLVDDNLGAWWTAIDRADLPNWFATVQPGNGALLHVIVQWDDSRATETATDSSEAKTSCLGEAIPAPMEEVCLTTVPCGG